jgi:hypothetical protein
MAMFHAGLCQMLGGKLQEPYEGATIDVETSADAIRRAKEWPATVEVAEGSWLQVLFDGKSLASFGPGEF